LGDGGSAGDPDERAQNDGEVLGKLLRLRANIDEPPYWAVPGGNPHPGAPGMLALVWAKGLRNPWRFSFDRATDALYVADVGQGEIEEIDYTPPPRPAGQNYGWDVFEGSRCFEPRPPATECPQRPNGMVFPIHEYDHSEGCSVTGGYVYRGCALPDLHGTYFYSDYCAGFIRTFEVVRGEATDNRDRTAELEDAGFVVGNTASFGQDTRGELYIVDRNGSVWRIVPRP
jgi:glucose/arabinose dehydrogenase